MASAGIIPLISALIGAGGAIGGSALARRGNQETPIQGRQRELIDQLMSSLGGDGPFSSLFNVDEESFQRSFVDPMKEKFRSQIAPQIQQGYISSGQQRGTGLDDKLSRAGVDMDQLLNQYYAQMQEGARNRQANAMGSILGVNQGAAPEQSMGQAIGQGITGYVGSEGFGQSMDDIIKGFTKKPEDNLPKTFIA